MADPRDTPTADSQTGNAASTKPDASSLKPGMTETEIRQAGLAIDVPFESGEPKPERLKYADLGKDKKFVEQAGGEQTDHGAGTHDGPLKGSEQAPSAVAPTGDLLSQDETGAQAASTSGTGAEGAGVQDAGGTDVT